MIIVVPFIDTSKRREALTLEALSSLERIEAADMLGGLLASSEARMVSLADRVCAAALRAAAWRGSTTDYGL